MYLPTPRKYRPKQFSEVFGQSSTKTILTNSILMNYPISSMLVSGIRGTGKTTLARIFAKSLNCENFPLANDCCNSCKSCQEADNGTHPDIFEFDSASHNGVDFVRDLEYLTRQIPTYGKRIMIFDEAHMFSTQAQNALLKVLEEPPKNLTFILVTTNPESIVKTVRSRCLSMPLKSLTTKEVAANIRHILAQENRQYTEEFIEHISNLGSGSLRDVQQILDQVLLASGPNELNLAYLQESVGIVTVNQYKQLAGVLCSKNVRKSYEAVNKWYYEGVDLNLLFEEGLPNLLRDVTICLSKSFSADVPYLTGIPHSLFEKNLTLTYEDVKSIQSSWLGLAEMMKNTYSPKLVWEMFFLKICNN